jgi:hypothetical protein
MNTKATAQSDDAQTVTIRLDVTYTLGAKTILDATAAAKALVDAAKEHGTVEGNLIFGRQKFRIS